MEPILMEVSELSNLLENLKYKLVNGDSSCYLSMKDYEMLIGLTTDKIAQLLKERDEAIINGEK